MEVLLSLIFFVPRIRPMKIVSIGQVFSRVWQVMKGIPRHVFPTAFFSYPSALVMPKSRNLPMTTREPISDAKAKEFLLPSSRWGSHRYRRSTYREEPRALGFIAYIGYSQAKNLKNGSFWVGRLLIGYLLWKG